jgi:hypothetical protein
MTTSTIRPMWSEGHFSVVPLQITCTGYGYRQTTNTNIHSASIFFNKEKSFSSAHFPRVGPQIRGRILLSLRRDSTQNPTEGGDFL